MDIKHKRKVLFTAKICAVCLAAAFLAVNVIKVSMTESKETGVMVKAVGIDTVGRIINKRLTGNVKPEKEEKQIVQTKNSFEASASSEKPENTENTNGVGDLTFSDEEKYFLTKIAMAEAEGEDTEGKALVMLVVLNRVQSSQFPDTIEDVIFQPGQFSPVNDGGRYWTTEPNDDCYKALELILNGWDKSEGALYFESGRKSDWHKNNLQYLYQWGNHYFYTEKRHTA